MTNLAGSTFDFNQLQVLVPEAILAVVGLVVLLLDVGALRRTDPARRRTWLGALSLLAPLLVLGWLIMPMIQSSTGVIDDELDPTILGGILADDTLTWTFHAIIAILLMMVVGLSMSWDFTEHWGVYYALLLWAGVGMMILISAEELVLIFLSLEMMTICLYLCTAFEKRLKRSPEAGMKYFLYGSVASAILLLGFGFLYGITGTTLLAGIRESLLARAFEFGQKGQTGLLGDTTAAVTLLLILVGLGFKIAAVPFHQWAPDTYEGAPAPVSAWIASGSKVASLIATMKLLIYGLGAWAGTVGGSTEKGWVGIVAAIAAITMTYGNLAALAQKNFKRLLAYSSIAHAGYMLVGVLAASLSTRAAANDAVGSVLFYLIVYSITTVSAFAIAAWLIRERGGDSLADLNGMGFRSPGVAACVVILMFSLIGLPPLAGFFAKLYMFMEVLDTNDSNRNVMLGLVGLGLLNTVISAYYYIRVLRALFHRGTMPEGESRIRIHLPRSLAWPLGFGTLVAIGLGLVPSIIMDGMRVAATNMLSMNAPISDRYTEFLQQHPGDGTDGIRDDLGQLGEIGLVGAAPSGGGGGGGQRKKADRKDERQEEPRQQPSNSPDNPGGEPKEPETEEPASEQPKPEPTSESDPAEEGNPENPEASAPPSS